MPAATPAKNSLAQYGNLRAFFRINSRAEVVAEDWRAELDARHAKVSWYEELFQDACAAHNTFQMSS